jgi:hypothetical protein
MNSRHQARHGYDGNCSHTARLAVVVGKLGSMLLSLLAVLVVAGAVATPADGQQDPAFVVIVNSANPVDSISVDQLSKIFLRKIRQWESNRTIQVVEQRMSSRIRAVFAEQVHRRSAAAVSAYWQQQIFSGRAVPPPERSTNREIVDYVAASIDAIGYVAPGTALGPDVKAMRVVR